MAHFGGERSATTMIVACQSAPVIRGFHLQLVARTNRGRCRACSQVDESNSKLQLQQKPVFLEARRKMLLSGAALLASLCLEPGKVQAARGSSLAEAVKEKLWVLAEEPSGAAASDNGSRVYDSTVLGEPLIMKDRERIWEKLLASRIVYLGEAEPVPDPDDKVLELEILKSLRDKCLELSRPITLALQAFPCVLQGSLNQYMNKSLGDDELKAMVPGWPEGRWEQYKPILQYCRNSGVRVMACGAPAQILHIIQTRGVQGLSVGDRKRFVPPAGLGTTKSLRIFQQSLPADTWPRTSDPRGLEPYLFAQARIVEDFTMSQVVRQATTDAGGTGIVVVITGASHVRHGTRGSGLPARMSRVLQKKKQTVVLLNPQTQRVRQEGEVPQADLLWYSSGKVCERNCFDRAEVARVMSAAGRRRDALPEVIVVVQSFLTSFGFFKDIRAGLDRGIISPELLQNFLELDKNPLLAELTSRFQGLRERLLADPRFLHRLAIEEAISITTTLIAQYGRRKGRFWKELDYVITDSVRGSVVDFFTVWLPAPRLAFRPLESDVGGGFRGLQGLLGALPDNAFQREQAGTKWGLNFRLLAVVVGGLKLFGVGFVSSIGTLSVTNFLLELRRKFRPELEAKAANKRSPIFKTALVYSTFLALSANLRYQFVAGVVEHWFADYFLASRPLAGNVLSFVARTANSYWGTQQWVDLARFSGLQAHRPEDQTVTAAPGQETPPKEVVAVDNE